MPTAAQPEDLPNACYQPPCSLHPVSKCQGQRGVAFLISETGLNAPRTRYIAMNQYWKGNDIITSVTKNASSEEMRSATLTFVHRDANTFYQFLSDRANQIISSQQNFMRTVHVKSRPSNGRINVVQLVWNSRAKALTTPTRFKKRN